MKLAMRDELRCTARAKGSGERCGRAAVVPGSVCVKHGGSTPQVARNARRVLLAAYARRCLWKIGEAPRPDADTLALAKRVDRLRRLRPRWWARLDGPVAW